MQLLWNPKKEEGKDENCVARSSENGEAREKSESVRSSWCKTLVKTWAEVSFTARLPSSTLSRLRTKERGERSDVLTESSFSGISVSSISYYIEAVRYVKESLISFHLLGTIRKELVHELL